MGAEVEQEDLIKEYEDEILAMEKQKEILMAMKAEIEDINTETGF